MTIINKYILKKNSNFGGILACILHFDVFKMTDNHNR